MIISGAFTLIRAKVSAIPLMLLRPAAGYAIFKTQRGKPQAATRYKLKLFISTVRQLFPVVGGYFYLLLKIL